MAIETVAIMSPGDMGHAVGRVLGQHGLRVITCLEGRSQRTRGLAKEAGIEDVPSLAELVTQADLILSVLVPAEAVGVAERVAAAMSATGATPVYADCNATSPQTKQRTEPIINGAGGRFVDAGIIGGPPGEGRPPKFFVCGPEAPLLMELELVEPSLFFSQSPRALDRFVSGVRHRLDAVKS